MVSERLVAWSKPIYMWCSYVGIHEEPVDRCSRDPTQFVSQRRRRRKLTPIKLTTMNTQMGASFEKLDRNNFASLEYKMDQYLGSRYIEGTQEMQPNPTHVDYPNIEASGKSCVVLSCIMRSWSHARLYSRVENAKRSLGQSQENFRCQHGYT